MKQSQFMKVCGKTSIDITNDEGNVNFPLNVSDKLKEVGIDQCFNTAVIRDGSSLFYIVYGAPSEQPTDGKPKGIVAIKEYNEFVNEKRDYVDIDIDFAGSDLDLKNISKRYNIKTNEYEPGHVILTGSKKDILAYLISPEYDMDMIDIKSSFPELLK